MMYYEILDQDFRLFTEIDPYQSYPVFQMESYGRFRNVAIDEEITFVPHYFSWSGYDTLSVAGPSLDTEIHDVAWYEEMEINNAIQ